MLVAFIIIAGVIGMKINGVIDAPWWFTVSTCIFVFIVGMFISGVVRVRVDRELE